MIFDRVYRAQWLSILSLGLVLGLAQTPVYSQDAQDVADQAEDDADSDETESDCENKSSDPDGDKPGCPDGESPEDDCGEGGDASDCENSFADMVSRTYMHYGFDYRIQAPDGSTCRDCGGMARDLYGLPMLQITRIHKQRMIADLERKSPFGPGVGLNYTVAMQHLDTGATPTRPATQQLRVFDFASRSPSSYTLTDYQLAPDGTLDPNDNVFPGENATVKHAELLDAAGVLLPVSQGIEDAVTVAVTFWDGRKWIFEVIDIEAGTGTDYWCRLVRREDRNGNAIKIDYEFVRDAADTALGSDRYQLFKIDKITDAYGNEADLTYHGSKVGSGGTSYWAVDRIDLPNGSHLRYDYDGSKGHLTEVLQYEDATATNLVLTSTFSYSIAPGGNAKVLSIDDPAAGGTHRRKDVHFTTDQPMNGNNQLPNRLRKIVNGEGEVSLALWNEEVPGSSGAQLYSYAYKGGMLLERYTTDNARIIKKEIAEGFTVDTNGDVIPTGWETIFEQPLASGPGDEGFSYFMPGERDDGLGRRTKYTTRDVTRRLKREIDYPDGTEELRSYNTSFNWMTFYTDRLGRLSRFDYDSNGNRTKEYQDYLGTDERTRSWFYTASEGQKGGEVGFGVFFGGAYYKLFQYSSTGDPASVDHLGYRVRVLEAPDVSGDSFPETTYTYDVSGRVIETVDPEGRVTAFDYDSRNRLTLVTHYDNSTTSYTYGVNLTNDANLLVSMTDRNGNVTTYGYDDHGRRTSVTEASGTPEAITSTQDHLIGTETVASSVSHGEATVYGFDSYNRRVSTTRYPSGQNIFNGSPGLTSTTTYDVEGRVRYTEDPYGRRTWRAYDINDRLTRTITEAFREISNEITLPSADNTAAGANANDEYLLELTRSTDANAGYLINDTIYDAEGQVIATIDPRGVLHRQFYDEVGRMTKTIEAVASVSAIHRYGIGDLPPVPSSPPADPDSDPGTTTLDLLDSVQLSIVTSALAATTEYDYDDQGNVLEVRHPRHFDSTDPQFGSFRTVMTYTQRNLLKSRTEGFGTADAATENYTYFLDGRPDTTTDARGNAWSKLWGLCCGRIMATIDPPADVDNTSTLKRAASITRHDAHGNLTHQGRVVDVSNVTFPGPPPGAGLPQAGLDLPDAETLSEVTTRYDARHRPIASTVWLVPRGTVHPDDVPIAGGGLPGDPAVEISGVVQGLTTTYTYDDDLADGVGLDSTYATPIALLGTGFFTATAGEEADGYAVAVTNPEGEVTVRVIDGIGRTVLSIDGEGDASTMAYDAKVTAAGSLLSGNGGIIVETSATDPLLHVTKSWTDGAGRTIQILDAASDAVTYTYDNNSNRLSFRDSAPGSGVGEDCVYDLRNREIECRDTAEIVQSDFRGTEYDAHSNVTRRTDAKGVDDICVFDARDRQINCTDRINAVTAYTYDDNSNLLTITDAESGVTTYTYDPRNLQTATAYPGHNPTSVVGDTDFDLVEMAYDGLQRPRTKTDQLDDTTAFVYDLASRLTAKQYAGATGSVNGPGGTNAADDGDDDLFTYDKASRLLTAESERYGNAVTMTYTDDSLLATENIKGNVSSSPAGYTLIRGYDADDRLTSITYPNGSVVTRAYTTRNQLDTITQDPDGAGPLASTQLADFTYDSAMRETARTLGNGLSTFRSYQRADHLLTKQLTHDSATPPVSGTGNRPNLWRTYTYDANKNLTAEGNNTPGDYSFNTSHDAEDRLTTYERENMEFQSWTLSAVGDWDATSGDSLVGGLLTSFSETRAHNDVHEITNITSGGVTTLTHDAKGNLTVDEDGNTYLWDFDNRLKEVRNSGGDLLASHTYDALGRRTTKTTPGSLPGDPDVTTAFVCLTSGGGMGQMLVEYESNTLKRLYTYGSYIDEPITLTRFDASLPGGEETLYYHRDRQYNVIALTDTTSGGGVAVERYVYTPYGERRVLDPDGVTVRQTSAVGNPLGHQGLYHDGETGLIYNRARYRDAGLGRWLGRDGFGYVDGMNLYVWYPAYSGGYDPSGYAKTMISVDTTGTIEEIEFRDYSFFGSTSSRKSIGAEVPSDKEGCCQRARKTWKVKNVTYARDSITEIYEKRQIKWMHHNLKSASDAAGPTAIVVGVGGLILGPGGLPLGVASLGLGAFNLYGEDIYIRYGSPTKGMLLSTTVALEKKTVKKCLVDGSTKVEMFGEIRKCNTDSANKNWEPINRDWLSKTSKLPLCSSITVSDP